jgi:carotenoid cleavage dioxygenase-like enzyme
MQAPLNVQPLPYVFGLKGIASCINFEEDKPTTVYLIPRDLSEPMVTVEVDTHFNFHFANVSAHRNVDACITNAWVLTPRMGTKGRKNLVAYSVVKCAWKLLP